MKGSQRSQGKLKDYVKIREMIGVAWGQKPITSLDIMNAYGKQNIDTKLFFLIKILILYLK